MHPPGVSPLWINLLRERSPTQGAPGTETKQEGFFVSRYRPIAEETRQAQADSGDQLLRKLIHDLNRESQVLVEIQA